MEQKRKIALILIGFIVLIILGYWMYPKEEPMIDTKIVEAEDFIFVHIEGEVVNPGLKKVKLGTRLYELIEEAGGETENADMTRINLASVLSDEQKIMIPPKVMNEDSGKEEISPLVNINTATKERLMTLNGVGEGTAEKIIKYREENGYFNALEDLKNVSGIGENKFNGLKDDITI